MKRIATITLATGIAAVSVSLVRDAVAQEVGLAPEFSDRYERQTALDVLHYDVSIRLPDEAAPIDGKTAILYQAVGGALDTIVFDLVAMTVDSVAVNGHVVPFTHSDGKLTLDTGGTADGERGEAVIWYRGLPADGLVLRPNRHGEFVVFADNWADRAHYWFPGIDHPADKATVAFDVEAPSAWRVVANGYLRSVEDLGSGRSRTRWIESAEISMYNMVIGAADFAVVEAGEVAGIEVSHWTFRPDSAAGEAAFARSVEILGFYDSLFGPFPYEKMAHVQATSKFGGMENASAIFYDENTIGGALDEGANLAGLTSLVAHETVHQWFGDAVTEKDWNHLWLSEGFATYFAAVFFEFHGGPDGSGPDELARRMRATIPGVAGFYRQTGQAIYDPGAGPGEYESLLNANNYPKGAWVLHMLRGLIGDDSFFDGIRSYYATLRDDTAWTSDFERIMETASGMDLGWFFAQWIVRGGHPVLALETRPASGGTEIVVRQTQAGGPFRFPLEVAVEGTDGSRVVERLMVDGTEASFVVRFAVEDVELDPGGWLLHERHEEPAS